MGEGNRKRVPPEDKEDKTEPDNGNNETVGNWGEDGSFSCLTGGQCSKTSCSKAVCTGCKRVLLKSFRFG